MTPHNPAPSITKRKPTRTDDTLTVAHAYP